MSDFELNAHSRAETGTRASRRLRRANGEIPAIIYGGKKQPTKIALPHKDLAQALENEAVYSQMISLSVDGKPQDVILKDLQRHPAKAQLLHADFLRVNKKQKLTVKAPLHFINEDSCVGVKAQGGVISRSLAELEISCLPADLPEYIEVDLAAVELDQIVHISDIRLPKGVESVALAAGEGHDLPVVAIHKAKQAEEEPPEGTEGDDGEATDAAETSEGE
ncbi:MAG: 50S ribosomal protein L25/general stress protein Ctc [Cellvibrionales bacterium]|nr:50S ribosomal protein L25/general stress protein Ctc [Cellvibrionales bacterium]